MDQRENRQHIANRRYYTTSLMLGPCCLWKNIYRVSVIPAMPACHRLFGSCLHRVLLFVSVI